jgi:hypothetical protein
MRWKEYGIILLCLILAGAFLTAAMTRQAPIRRARQGMGLVLNDPLENMPPSLAATTVAMGAFRGLIVDILWMRADTLKQEGKYFDAKQLAEWITMLQPRFAKVWDFHAWNMAYNISVAMPNTQCEERWRWVRNGIELLRDRGIPLNPKDINLYQSLGRIYQHKVGDVMDDCHRYYKKELALEIRPLLGDNTNREFDRLAAAPRTLAEAAADPGVREIVEALRRADEAFRDDGRLVENYLALRQSPDRFSKEAFAVIDGYRQSPAMEALDVFARAWVLRSKWKLNIEEMIELNREFGPVAWDDPDERLPLNWEHPAAHAIYWAVQGLKIASHEGQYRISEKNTDRLVFHSLQQLYRNGNMILYTTPEKQTTVFLRPDLRMFRSCDQAWRDSIQKYTELEGNPKGITGGHKNFLENVVMSMYQSGHKVEAARIYEELRRLYPKDDAGQIRPEYQKDFMDFIVYRMTKEMEGVGLEDAMEAVVLHLREAYFLYAMHEDNESAAREDLARQIYAIYDKERNTEPVDRVNLPPMEMLLYAAFQDFWMDPQYPDSLKMSLAGRIQVEKPEMFEQLRKQEEWWRRQMQRIQQEQVNQP